MPATCFASSCRLGPAAAGSAASTTGRAPASCATRPVRVRAGAGRSIEGGDSRRSAAPGRASTSALPAACGAGGRPARVKSRRRAEWPVRASTRRTPAGNGTLVDRRGREPISPGPARTWVPPQSSTEIGLPGLRVRRRQAPPIETTRTSSPYFSPKSAMAHSASIAWSVGHQRGSTPSESIRTRSFTVGDDALHSRRVPPARSASGWEMSKRRRSGATSEPFCADMRRRESLPEGGMQQMGRRVVCGGSSGGARHRRSSSSGSALIFTVAARSIVPRWTKTLPPTHLAASSVILMTLPVHRRAWCRCRPDLSAGLAIEGGLVEDDLTPRRQLWPRRRPPCRVLRRVAATSPSARVSVS